MDVFLACIGVILAAVVVLVVVAFTAVTVVALRRGWAAAYPPKHPDAPSSRDRT